MRFDTDHPAARLCFDGDYLVIRCCWHVEPQGNERGSGSLCVSTQLGCWVHLITSTPLGPAMCRFPIRENERSLPACFCAWLPHVGLSEKVIEGEKMKSGPSAVVANSLWQIWFPLFEWKMKALPAEALRIFDLWWVLQIFPTVHDHGGRRSGCSEPEGIEQRHEWLTGVSFLCPLHVCCTSRISERNIFTTWLKTFEEEENWDFPTATLL